MRTKSSNKTKSNERLLEEDKLVMSFEKTDVVVMQELNSGRSLANLESINKEPVALNSER